MNKAGRIALLTVVIVVILGAVIASVMPKPKDNGEVWYEEMTLGDRNAKNHFVVYSDLVCQYCIAFENTLIENQDELMKYLDENDIFLEIRLSDYLYNYSEYAPAHSKNAAVAAYCAKNEGKFWDFYDKAVTTMWNDYIKPGQPGITAMSSMGPEYWIDLGKGVGLGENFENCVNNQETLAEVEEAAVKSQGYSMPSFVFNGNTLPSVFDLDGDWDTAKMIMNIGLNAK